MQGLRCQAPTSKPEAGARPARCGQTGNASSCYGDAGQFVRSTSSPRVEPGPCNRCSGSDCAAAKHRELFTQSRRSKCCSDIVRGVVKAHADDNYHWAPPRGLSDFTRRTGWWSTLEERVRHPWGHPHEKAAVNTYWELITTLDAERRHREWYLRELARRAGLSQSAVATAFSGSTWPRWPTLTTIASTLDHALVLDGHPGDDPVKVLAGRLDRLDGLPIRMLAAETVVRPNTLYALCDRDRAPSSSTVLALAAQFEQDIRAERRYPVTGPDRPVSGVGGW